MLSFSWQERRHHKYVCFYNWLPNYWNNRPGRIRIFSSNLELKERKGWRLVIKGKKNMSLWKRCAPLWQLTGTNTWHKNANKWPVVTGKSTHWYKWLFGYLNLLQRFVFIISNHGELCVCVHMNIDVHGGQSWQSPWSWSYRELKAAMEVLRIKPITYIIWKSTRCF